jgi:hypothetical protein
MADNTWLQSKILALEAENEELRRAINVKVSFGPKTLTEYYHQRIGYLSLYLHTFLPGDSIPAHLTAALHLLQTAQELLIHHY